MTPLQNLFHELNNSANTVKSIEQFKAWTRVAIRPLLPHGALACGYGHIHAGGVALDGVVAIDYPAEHLNAIRNQGGGVDTPILRRWLMTREPQFFDPDAPWPDVPTPWLESFRSHQLGRTAVHGIYDTERCLGTYHSFHRITVTMEERHAELLRSLAPILHDTLCRLLRPQPEQMTPTCSSLNAREQEIAKWVELGKTNAEVAILIGSSESAVKHHLIRIFDKLGVSNRSQLVRRLSELKPSTGQIGPTVI